MDRYIIREPRAGADYPQENQGIAFSANTVTNNVISPPPGNIYYRSYGTEFSNIQRTPNLRYVGFSYMNSPQAFTSPTNPPPGQSQMLSGIDPRYLAGYSDNSAQFVVTGQPIQGQSSANNISYGPDYQNENSIRSDINNMTVLTKKAATAGQTPEGQATSNVSFGSDYQNHNFVGPNRIYYQKTLPTPADIPRQAVFGGAPRNEPPKVKQLNVHDYKTLKSEGKQEYESNNCALQPRSTQKEPTKKSKSQMRWNKLEVLYKRGLLVFSGPVEKILKWHKSLQDTGVLALYEVIGKCVSVRPGESCAKNLVVRDENGPAMQVVYYEIDFHLPDLKLPCVVRVVGKMMVGTCRLQAFKVRPATGDDVAMLPRRAAVSAHHITKLFKEIENA